MMFYTITSHAHLLNAGDFVDVNDLRCRVAHVVDVNTIVVRRTWPTEYFWASLRRGALKIVDWFRRKGPLVRKESI